MLIAWIKDFNSSDKVTLILSCVIFFHEMTELKLSLFFEFVIWFSFFV